MKGCFCHFNGYEVKDAKARADIEQIANNHIPDEYLQASIDAYMEDNDGGLATLTDLEKLDTEISSVIDEHIVTLTDELFNKSQITANSFFKMSNNKSVGIEYNETVSITNPIKVFEGDIVNIFCQSTESRTYIIADDENSFVDNNPMVFISGKSEYNPTMLKSGYLRVAFFNTELDNFSVKIDNRKRVDCVSNGLLNELKKNFVTNSKFVGKTFSIIGDSLTFGYGTTKRFTDILNEKLGLSSLYNYGINGSTIANGQNSMATRCVEMNVSDVIIAFGGTNDFGCYPTIIGDIFTEENNAKVLNYDVATFAGAMNTLCKNLLTTFNGKEIYVLSPIHREKFESQPSDLQKNSKGLHIESYIECMEKVCELWGVKFFNMMKEFPYNPNIPIIKNTYFGTNDGLHLNALGHEKLADTIIKLIG